MQEAMVRRISPQDVLRLVVRWWWILLLCPLLAAGAAYLASSVQTPIYRASITLLIEQSQSQGSTTYNDILASQQRVATYSRLITARPVLEETISRLNLPVSASTLAGRVIAVPIRDTQLLSVSVSDPSPQNAATIANTIGQVFIDQTRSRQNAVIGTGNAEIQKNITDAKRQIDETQARITEIKNGPSATSPASQAELLSLQSLLSQYQTSYSTLLEAQQRNEIAVSQAVSQVNIAEQAVPPSHFVSPRILVNTVLAAVLGVFVAIGLVALAVYLDNTVKNSEDVRRLTGSAALGMIPLLQGHEGLEVLRHSRSVATEGYRGLRTNLQFSMAESKHIKSIVVTSTRQRDGKTTTATNLAVVLAQGGQRVILVDGDLRKPRVHRAFPGLMNHDGLSNLLLNHRPVDSFLQNTTIPGLTVLTSGPLPPNPADILTAPRMREVLSELEERADIVLIDMPPLVVSDPLILTAQADGFLIVTVSGRTRTTDLTHAIRTLTPTGTPLIGVVVNRADLKGEGYYYYYRSYYTEESEPPKDAGKDGSQSGPQPGQRRALRRQYDHGGRSRSR